MFVLVMSGHVTADPRLPLSSRPRSRNIRYTLLDRPCSATTARLLSATSTSALAIGHRAFLLGSVIERRTRCARVLTLLPGSEDHKILFEKNVWMDPDMNKYELEHVVTAHAKMSKEEWQSAYRSAWDVFYTDEHLETISGARTRPASTSAR